MKKQNIITLFVVLFVSVIAASVVTAVDNEKSNFLFVLSSDNSNNVTRCFQFAKIAHSKGYKVNIFLIDDAVIWAIPGKAKGIKALTGDSADDYLDYLVKNSVPISV